MDNNNRNKLNSKDLEQDALEMLNRAVKNGFIPEGGDKVAENKEAETDTAVNKVKVKPVKSSSSTERSVEERIKELEEKIEEHKARKAEENKNNAALPEEDVEEEDLTEEPEETVESNNDESTEETAEDNDEVEADPNEKEDKDKDDNEACDIQQENSEEELDGAEKHDDKTPEAAKPKSEEEEQEELRSLIAAAIENKRILRQAGQPAKKKQSPKAAEAASSDIENKPKKKWTWKRKTKAGAIALVALLLLIIALVVCLFLYYMGLLKPQNPWDNSSAMGFDDSELTSGDPTFDQKKREEELRAQLAKNAKPISDKDVFNILLVGEDVRDPNEAGEGNTDVMMIISINSKNDTITLTSLLRDAWIYMEKYDESSKLNAAYWHGGSEYLEDIVEQYYGIEIDRYVSVNFQSFIDVVEAVGGLDFNITKAEAEAMKDPLDEVNDIMGKKHGTDYVKTGKQHLNGYQALAYSRIRYNVGDDYGRTKRQRAVISQIIKKAKKLSLTELDALLKKVLKKVNTDVTNGEAASMLLSAFDYMTYDVQQLQIPASGYFTDDFAQTATGETVSVLSPAWDANRAIIQKVIYGKEKTAEEAAEAYQKENQ